MQDEEKAQWEIRMERRAAKARRDLAIAHLLAQSRIESAVLMAKERLDLVALVDRMRAIAMLSCMDAQARMILSTSLRFGRM